MIGHHYPLAVMSSRARKYVYCGRAMLRHMEDHGIQPKVDVEFYRGTPRIHINWYHSTRSAHRQFQRLIDHYILEMNQLYNQLSQEELRLAHGQLYRDVLRPPIFGQIGFEDTSDEWEQ